MFLSLSILDGCLSLSLPSHGVAIYVSLSLMVAGVSHCLSCPIELLHISNCLRWLLSVSYSLHGNMEWLHVFHWLPWLLAFAHFHYQCHGFAACLSLSSSVLSDSMELLHDSHCLPWFLAVSYSLSVPMELLHVSHCYSLLLERSHCPSQCHEVATSLSKLLIVVCFLSLFFPVTWGWFMSLILSHDCWLSLTVSPSAKELLHFSHYLPWFQAISYCLCGPRELLHVSHCLLCLLALSHRLSGPMQGLRVSHCVPWLLAVPHCHSKCHKFVACLSLSPIVASFL